MLCKPDHNQRITAIVIIFVTIAAALAVSCGKMRKPATQSLASGTISIPAGNYNSIRFSTQKKWNSITVTGEYSAKSGSENDIRAMIMTMINFMNYSNGRKAAFVYDSGQFTSGKIELTLPSVDEDYVLVFDNTMSGDSAVQVNAAINLNYK